MTAGKLPVRVHRRLIETIDDYDVVVRRMWIRLEFETDLPNNPRSERCLVDTGAPFCVIPKEVWDQPSARFNWHPLTSSKKITWQGAPCTLGRVFVEYKPLADRSPRGPFLLVAKFVDKKLTPQQRDRLGMESAVPILLGMSFLGDHLCHTEFHCHTSRHGGAIEFP